MSERIARPNTALEGSHLRHLLLFGLAVLTLGLLTSQTSAQTFDVAGHTLRYEDVGRGEVVVLVSGWTQSLETWDLRPTLPCASTSARAPSSACPSPSGPQPVAPARELTGSGVPCRSTMR